MTWHGQNRSGRTHRWSVGDLVRYDDGPTALMRITSVREMDEDPSGIACSVRYYGRAFHDRISYYENGEERGIVGRYHGQCQEASPADIVAWNRAHDSRDDWKPGCW